LYHWRTSQGDEVDIIFSRGLSDVPLAIEIKSSDSPTEKDLGGLIKFYADNPKANLYCFCLTPKAYQLGNIIVLPWREGILDIIR
jgi:predicted AAA+ superfamily ATPase